MKRYTPYANRFCLVGDGDIEQKTLDQYQRAHADDAKVQSNAARQEDVEDGWYGIGTFGKVGPCDSLRQAMIRSGI